MSNCKNCYELQQQLEAYKMEAEEGKEINAELKEENEELKKNYFTVIQQRNVAEQQLDQLKEENEGLKEKIMYLEFEIDRLNG